MWMFESILSLSSSIFPGLNQFWTQFVTDWTFRALWLIVASCDQFWPILTHCNPNSPNLTEFDPKKFPAWLVLLFLSARPCEWEACLRQFNLKVNVKLFNETEKLSFGRWFFVNFICCKKYWIHIKTNARNSMLELSDKLPISAIYGKWENTLAIYGCRGGEGGI